MSNKLDFMLEGNFENGLEMEKQVLLWLLKSLGQSDKMEATQLLEDRSTTLKQGRVCISSILDFGGGNLFGPAFHGCE